MNKTITPQISTLVAELRVIKIGNKQMTLAVFNQLYEGKCYDEDYNISHQLWGRVYWKDETWIVFQKSDALFRYKVDSSLNEHIEDSFDDALVSWAIGTYNSYAGYVWDKVRGVLVKHIDGLIKWAGEEPRDPDKLEEFTRDRMDLFRSTQAPRLIKKYLCNHEIMGKLEDHFFKSKLLKEKRKALYNKLNSIDQLFIAV